MNRIYKFLLVATLLSFTVFHSYGQPPEPPADEDGIPVDGGVELLVAAGVLFGIKKLKEKK